MRVHRFQKGNYDNLRSEIASFASAFMASTFLRNNAFEKNWSVVSGELPRWFLLGIVTPMPAQPLLPHIYG